MKIERIPGDGWLVLVGGGEFSFGQTEDADRAWLAKLPETAHGSAETAVGFLPTASGSTEYGGHFAAYLDETHGERAETIPIYRARDAKRGKNSTRIAESRAAYLGGGVTDHLLDAFVDSPALEALVAKLEEGGVVVTIAAAAEALGGIVRSLLRQELVAGLGFLRGGGVATNFDPSDERRLRELLEHPAVKWGLGLPAGSAVLLGPDGAVETVGDVFTLDGPDHEIQAL